MYKPNKTALRTEIATRTVCDPEDLLEIHFSMS